MQIPRLTGFIPLGPKGLKSKRSERVAALRAEDARIQAERRARLNKTYGRAKLKHSAKKTPGSAFAATSTAKPTIAPPRSTTARPAFKATLAPQNKPAPRIVASTPAPTPAVTNTAPTPAPTPVVAPVATAPSPINTQASAPSKSRGSYANAFSERGRSYMTLQTSRSHA